jgi:hypothetical protein
LYWVAGGLAIFLIIATLRSLHITGGYRWIKPGAVRSDQFQKYLSTPSAVTAALAWIPNGPFPKSELCESLRSMAADAAEARNAGVPLDLYRARLDANVEAAAKQFGIPARGGHVEPFVVTANVEINAVYAHPEWTPEVAKTAAIEPGSCHAN